ncbi:RNA pseudouridine synthase [Snodgrassella communis]|jgi:23S rRNA pseudouridine1911/1915/1917 synthase|uniref:23S rRNA pseudouridine(1911/1915/1917) synthase RluD n=1 Tax=Snodgrassella communis TaxID=2946699 RepID=UPI000C1F3116|nr:23S rRNA pseudouridine(1911/1915/1917) synthase RluD [Snodgrassella communis]PIT20911.1 RNA pseudouridine synthase [Snodgrassella communis]
MEDTSLLENDDDYNDDLPFAADDSAQTYKNWAVPNDLAGLRLDAALAKLVPEFSRSRLTAWIKDNHVTVNGSVVPPKYKLIGGETIQVAIQQDESQQAFVPESMPLDIIYEDDCVLVLNKPAGLVVHPAAGNWHGTLLNGLLAYCPALAQVPRAGIVHRLDKDTSGLMVVAKTVAAQTQLVRQLQARTVKRTYRAVADGTVPFDGKIETLIGRDPHNRIRMAVVPFGGKEAITHVKVLERYADFSYIECQLETGRTHQIRVHMKAAGHPLAGDALYGNPRQPATAEVKAAIKAMARQALHAYRLCFVHPQTQETMQFEAPLPADIYHLLSVLRLQAGMDSAIKTADEWQQRLGTEAEDEDWDDDDYDVDVIYVRE